MHSSMVKPKPTFLGWYTLYALIGRVRIMSTPKVVGIADQIGRKILDSYLAPDKTFLELREMVKSEFDRYYRRIQRGLPRGVGSLRARQF
jgi:hypothetical protein